jgi:hypothetical protein
LGATGPSRAKAGGVTWTCELVVTIEFAPDETFLAPVLADLGVERYLVKNRSWLYYVRLYIMTGVKITLVVSMINSCVEKFGVNLHAGIGLASLTHQMLAEVKAAFQSQKDGSVNAYVGKLGPFVLVYRLRRLKVNCNLLVTENEVFDRRAMFGNDKRNYEVEPYLGEITLDASELEDVAGESFGMMEHEITDGDGEKAVLHLS